MLIDLDVLIKEPLKSFNYSFEEMMLGSDWFLTDNYCKETFALEVQMSAYYNEDIVYIKGEQTVIYDAVCDRCAEVYKATDTGLFREEIKLSSGYESVTETVLANVREVSDSFGGLSLQVKDGFLDLREFFRHFFLASLNLKSLCSDSCMGLCAVCGTNKNYKPCSCVVDNTDVRLMGLLKLKDKLK